MGIIPAVLSFHSSWAHLKEVSREEEAAWAVAQSAHPQDWNCPGAIQLSFQAFTRGEVNVAALRVTQLLSALAAPASALPP